jgi:HPt (histidine-containing phosphotransfer) domain-containing protein
MTSPSDAGFPAPPGNGHILFVEEGLERLMGDRALYLQMLRRFRQTYQDSVAWLRQAQADGDQERLLRKVHTLKGAAGMIGAQQVYRHAEAMERACATPGAPCGNALDQLAPALHSVLGMIESILDGMDPTPDTAEPPAPPASAQLLVQHLSRLLEDGDGAAIDVLEQSASVLAASLGVAVFQEVTAAAHEFDFEAAREALATRRLD